MRPEIRIDGRTGVVALRWPGDPAWYRLDHAQARALLGGDVRAGEGDGEAWSDPMAELERLREENRQLRDRLEFIAPEWRRPV
ncbi:hypothetical protein [Amycolatopsis arida]|uniref:hypothetical protein n=1 Tax=Amycolatopsis arida TaxID=587909 RepID=UPI001065B6C5|nr:hypothetical protein [Amycolatopsis arida]